MQMLYRRSILWAVHVFFLKRYFLFFCWFTAPQIKTQKLPLGTDTRSVPILCIKQTQITISPSFSTCALAAKTHVRCVPRGQISRPISTRSARPTSQWRHAASGTKRAGAPPNSARPLPPPAPASPAHRIPHVLSSRVRATELGSPPPTHAYKYAVAGKSAASQPRGLELCET